MIVPRLNLKHTNWYLISNINVTKSPICPILHGFNGSHSCSSGWSIGSSNGLVYLVINTGKQSCILHSFSSSLEKLKINECVHLDRQQGESNHIMKIKIKICSYINGMQDRRVGCGMGALENSTIPFSGSWITIAEHISPKTLFSAFMPRTLIAMAIGKVIHTKTIYLVCKVFTRIPVAIPATNRIDEQSMKATTNCQNWAIYESSQVS